MKYPASPLTPFLASLLCIRRKIHIPSEQREPKGLDQLSAHTSIACALLNSLLALFSAPVLSFQWLAHSFAKTRGVWGIPNVLRDTRVGTFSFSPLVTHHSSLSSLFLFMRLQIPPFAASINMPRLFIQLQIPLRANPFFSHRYKTPGVSPCPDSKAFSVPSVPLWQNSLGLPVLS